jgi:DNA-binding NarL/FixJ family response regulator
MIDVLVVDDHPIVLAGLAALIGSDPQLSVVGTARSVAEARKLVGQLEHGDRPSVAVLDLQLPDGDGITLGMELKSPGLRCVC